MNCALRLLLLPFLTTAGGFVITSPPPTPTSLSIPQRTRYGAFGPAETFFQIQPTVDREHEIKKREWYTTTINTCGWTSRDAYYPKTCPPGLGCGWIKGGEAYDYGVVCVPYDDAGEFNWADAMLPTTCIGYGGLNITIASAWSQTWSSTLWCGSSAKACATAEFEDGPSSIAGVGTSYQAYRYTSMFCTDQVTRVQVFQGVTNSVLPSLSSSSSSSSIPASSSSSSSSIKGEALAKSKSASNSATPTPANKSSDSTPVGEIAGATVGGVLGIAAIAGLAFFLLWRKRRERKHPPLELSRDPSEMNYAHPHPYLDSPQNRMGYFGQQTRYLPQMDFGDPSPYSDQRPFMQGIGRAV